MKNTHIKNLKKPVPKRIRLEVYKELVEYYEGDINRWDNSSYKDKTFSELREILPEGNFSTYHMGLCLVAPCALWDLPDFLSNPIGVSWTYPETTKAFPELEPLVKVVKKSWNKNGGSNYDEVTQVRLEGLKEIIKNFK